MEKGMSPIGFIDFGFALVFGQKQACFGKSIEFNPNRVGRLVKFFGKSAQVTRIGMGKELQEKFDAGFGSDEGVEDEVGS